MVYGRKSTFTMLIIKSFLSVIFNVCLILTTQSKIPDIFLETIAGNNVTIGQAVVFELNFTIPSGEEGTFNFEVLAPYNESAAQMSIGDVRVVSQGVNVPCITDEVLLYFCSTYRFFSSEGLFTWDATRRGKQQNTYMYLI